MTDDLVVQGTIAIFVYLLYELSPIKWLKRRSERVASENPGIEAPIDQFRRTMRQLFQFLGLMLGTIFIVSFFVSDPRAHPVSVHVLIWLGCLVLFIFWGWATYEPIPRDPRTKDLPRWASILALCIGLGWWIFFYGSLVYTVYWG